MKFHFFAHNTFEPWDYTNPIKPGIGGSETSQIEMASRLAARNHEVYSYAPVPWADTDKERVHRNVTWRHSDTFEQYAKDEDGIFVIYRCPEALDMLMPRKDNQEVWFLAQDTFYRTWTEERGARVDIHICLCQDHAMHVGFTRPYLQNKIRISSNGISLEVIRETEKLNLERDPHRLIYTSSPDRGLEPLIHIFKRALEFNDKLNLHVFYGYDNIDKVIKMNPRLQKDKDRIMDGIASTNGAIQWHGRLGQLLLTQEWFKSNIWCYPVNFTETSCISCMEAQACGVIPITSPKWALRENVMHGVLLEGNILDSITLARYSGEIVRIAQNPKFQDNFRVKMMQEARLRFNWERFVDQWESWVYNPISPYFACQFAFQQRYAEGTILNIGSDKDSSGFRSTRKATNMDVTKVNPITGEANAEVDIIHDIRKTIPVDWQNDTYKYDTVILGDILEHMTRSDAILAMMNARNFMKPTGKLIITCPNDTRSIEQQVIDAKGKMEDTDTRYVDGVATYHPRPISLNELLSMVHEAGFKEIVTQQIDYTWFYGNGVVCK